jgi:hypothetical protein
MRAAQKQLPASKFLKAWTADEDRQLIETLVKLGKVSWKEIACRMGSRASYQCRDRWHKVLKRQEGVRKQHPELVASYRRNPVPKTVDVPVAEAEPPGTPDCDLFAIEFPPLPLDDLRFSFEELHALGALPHRHLPIPPPVAPPISPTLQIRVVPKPKFLRARRRNVSVTLLPFDTDFRAVNRLVNRPQKILPRPPPLLAMPVVRSRPTPLRCNPLLNTYG